MAGIKDFLFGSDALKKAAGDAPTSTANKSQPAGIDIGKMAQEQADQTKASTPAKPPAKLSTTMTPQAPMKKAGK